MSQPTGKKRQRRSGYQASFNGCQTCKDRKIRCGMSRPVCQQCIKSKRQCSGPVTVQYRFAEPETAASLPSNSTSEDPHFQLSFLRGNDEERRAFDYFIHAAAPNYAGQHDTDFWRDLVPRRAMSDSVLWSAVLSLSQLHQQIKTMPIDGFGHTRALSAYKRSMEYHALAIRKQRQRLKSQACDLPNALLTCTLMAMFEFHISNVDNGLALVKNCFSLASQIKRCPTGFDLTAGILCIFLRLSTFIQPLNSLPKVLCGPCDGVDMLKLSLMVPLPLQLDEYRSRLYGLMNEASAVIEGARMRSSTIMTADEVVTRQTQILQRLGVWRTAVLEFQQTTTCDIYIWATSLLLTHYFMTHIQLFVCTSNLETAYDQQLSAFRSLVQYGTIALECASSSRKVRSPLLFELNPILPLFHTAVKCRHPLVRRRARCLLESFETLTRASGPWIADVTGVIMEIEEPADAVQGSTHLTVETLALFVPETARVRQFQVVRPEDDRSGLKVPKVITLDIKACTSEFRRCVRRVGILLDSREIVKDKTAHASHCPQFIPTGASTDDTTAPVQKAPTLWGHVTCAMCYGKRPD